MNKTYTQLWLAAALLGIFLPAHSQNYSIQLCAFTETIQPLFFKYAGFDEISHHEDAYNFNRYYWGEFNTLAEAQAQLKEASQQATINGLGNMQIIQLPTLPFATPIGYTSSKTIAPKTIDKQLFTRLISLKQELLLNKLTVKTLNEVANILKANPTLKLRIIGQKQTGLLADSAVDVIEHFLLFKEIPAYRLKILALDSQEVTETEKSSFSVQNVLLTLVDLKEEIVLDNFSKKDFLVKKEGASKVANLLE